MARTMKTSQQMLDEAWADAVAANAARFPGRLAGKTVTLWLFDHTIDAYEDTMTESLFDSRPLLYTLRSKSDGLNDWSDV